MFHRHHDADGGQLKPGREQQWEKIIGNVVDKRLLPAQYQPHPKIFGVQLHPEGREPFRGEVHVSLDDWNWEDLYQPQIGDVRGFVVNPAALFLVTVAGLLLPPVRAYAGLVRR